jgi:hypothetical protein
MEGGCCRDDVVRPEPREDEVQRGHERGEVEVVSLLLEDELVHEDDADAAQEVERHVGHGDEVEPHGDVRLHEGPTNDF